MVIRKADQRLQVRDNVRGGNGRLENRHIVEPDAMFGSATLFPSFSLIPAIPSAPIPTTTTPRSTICWRESWCSSRTVWRPF